MSRKIDPHLASILDSIRATMGVAPESPDAPSDGGANPDAFTDAATVAEAGPALSATTVGPGLAPGRLPGPGRSVEDFLADLIRPQVNAWLQQHLPEIVQKLAQSEIERLTGKV